MAVRKSEAISAFWRAGSPVFDGHKIAILAGTTDVRVVVAFTGPGAKRVEVGNMDISCNQPGQAIDFITVPENLEITTYYGSGSCGQPAETAYPMYSYLHFDESHGVFHVVYMTSSPNDRIIIQLENIIHG